MELKKYLTEYSEQAFNIVLQKSEQRHVNEWKFAVESSEFQSELQNLSEALKEVIVNKKRLVLSDIQHEFYIKDKSKKPRYLNHLRLYLEFRNLYDIASKNLGLKDVKIEPEEKTSYVAQDRDNENAIKQFNVAVEKIIKNDSDFSCFPIRFRMLPTIILNENKYSLERKKYLLKRMFVVLNDNKSNLVINELLSDFLSIIEPYEDIYNFVYKNTQSENDLKPMNESEPNKVGRPKAEKFTAMELLTDKIYKKGNFLSLLKDKYEDAKPKEFVHVLFILFELDYIKEKERIVIYNAFENYFGKKYSGDKNKNAFWGKTKRSELMKIETEIISIKEQSII
ncbi:hypothetical protein [Bizionia sp.]|uniref:hypothetical protein n=1 Tax=Bizionia sp. TaxID=1954480 RepID=UPI003A94E1B6